ncbi:MAG: hypothetical protein IJR99_14095 [Kiritimatiellae bacterium]|nr:hypothetical protein [Kiritimatiellia bacterium]
MYHADLFDAVLTIGRRNNNLTAISREQRFSFDRNYKDSYGRIFSEKFQLDLRLNTDAAIQVEPGMKEVVDGIAKVEKAI